jgi:hypothetical protein
MKKINLLFAIILIFINSCNVSDNGKIVRTFHPSVKYEDDYYDKVYDPENNVIYYISRDLIINGPNASDIKILDLNKNQLTYKEIKTVYSEDSSKK